MSLSKIEALRDSWAMIKNLRNDIGIDLETAYQLIHCEIGE